MHGDPSSDLTLRERELLELVVTGATNQQIALALDISINTVKAHLRNIFAKLGVESRTEATLLAIQQGLVTLCASPLSTVEEFPQGQSAVARIWPDLQGVRWPLHSLQRVAVLVGIVLLGAALAWPVARFARPAPHSRLVDISGGSAAAEAFVDQDSRWKPRSSLSIPRGRFAQTEVEGLVYVVGGLTESGCVSRVETYDPKQDRWEQRADKPVAVANIGAAAVGGRIHVPGGLDADGQVRNVHEVYDPAADTWSTAASLPFPVCAYAIAPVEGGFYLFGGWDGHRYLDKVLFYDATADTWHDAPPLRVARGFAAAVAAPSGIYLLGGYDGEREIDLCESFDPALAVAGEDPWHMHTPMTYGRAGHGAALVDGSLYVVGGGWDHPLDSSERYDLSNDAWSRFGTPNAEWHALGLSAVDTVEGALLIAVGGWSGRYLNTVDAYQASYRIFLPSAKGD
ncbi:MAG: LuxR C-terminal-related transcriptional regulator [Anaerolineae bacterium]